MPDPSSARREYERRRVERLQQLRDHRLELTAVGVVCVLVAAVIAQVVLTAWWLGVIIGALPFLSILAPSQREVAWRKGAEGELAVSRALDALGAQTRALHDRQIPGSRANIDHILIAPTGVWTIDAKNYTGKLETRGRGQELWVTGRNRSKLLDQARRQTAVVTKVLAAEGLSALPVKPALCFVGVEWPLLFRPKHAGDVALVSLRSLATLMDGETALTTAEITRVAAALNLALLPMLHDSLGAAPARALPALAMPVAAPTAPATAPVTVAPWNRFGKRRIYVNDVDGTTLGYVDLATNEVVPTAERHRARVTQAVVSHLRSS